jgi:hypothetical protein
VAAGEESGAALVISRVTVKHADCGTHTDAARASDSLPAAFVPSTTRRPWMTVTASGDDRLLSSESTIAASSSTCAPFDICGRRAEQEKPAVPDESRQSTPDSVVLVPSTYALKVYWSKRWYEGAAWSQLRRSVPRTGTPVPGEGAGSAPSGRSSLPHAAAVATSTRTARKTGT